MKPETVRRKLLSELHKLIPDLVDGPRQGEEPDAYAKRFSAAERAADRILTAGTVLNTIDVQHEVGRYALGTELTTGATPARIGTKLVMSHDGAERLMVVKSTHLDRDSNVLTVTLVDLKSLDAAPAAALD